jgi:hydroxymethylbilane synthase
MTILVAARASALSKAQLSEVYQELKNHHPLISFQPLYIETHGDKDLKTSLRGLEKTDFFTREVDRALLEGKCNIAIHSAKDLPETVDRRLTIAAITQGVDSCDVLVLKEGLTLEKLKKKPIIATSSERREESVKAIIPAATFIDLRGTVEKRLELLTSGKADGVVVAKAALIRLNLLHLNHIDLPGTTTPLQGQLAIVTRKHATAMIKLFSCLDVR